MIEVENTSLEGVKVVTPQVFRDDRGYFMETFNAGDAAGAQLPERYVQDNHSYSRRGVLRGLHYQYPQWQGKLVRVVVGEIFDVAVDIRPDSPTRGQWVSAVLSGENRKQMYIPDGFAHGFCVTSENAHVIYKVTTLYAADQDRCIVWNDPDIAIRWPLDDPIVSSKDAHGMRFKDMKFD